MFYDARSFDQHLGLWEVAQVFDMHEMFFTASTFNQDISLWDISRGTRINKIFEGAFAFISSFPGKHSSTWLHFPRGNNARSNFRTVESVPVVYFGVCLRKVQRENDITKLINSKVSYTCENACERPLIQALGRIVAEYVDRQ
jgi:hypothetical protein